MLVSHNIEEKKRFMQTPIGTLFKWVGRCVAVFCIIKVFTTVRSVFFESNVNTANNLSRNIRSFLSYLPFAFTQDIYNDLMIQYISFLFVGILIYLNVNSLFNNLLASLKNILMREMKIKFNSNTTMIIFCFFMGIYFMSNVLLMSMNLHDKYRDSLDEILEKQLDYLTIKRLFDYVFLTSTLCSFCILSFNRYVKS